MKQKLPKFLINSKFWYALTVICLIFTPAITFLPFMLIVDGFILTIELRTAAEFFAIFSATVYMSAILHPPVDGNRRKWFDVKKSFNSKSVGILIFVMLMGGVLGHQFVYGPISFVLHHAMKTQEEYVVKDVVGVHTERRPCRVAAQLEHHGHFWKRRVCNISEDEALGFHGGGQIKLIGSVSRYGVHVKQYQGVYFNIPTSGIKIAPPVGTLNDLRRQTPTTSIIRADK